MSSAHEHHKQDPARNYTAAVEWRRRLHSCAQPAWLEFYATALAAEKLTEWGYEIKMGADIIDADKVFLLPDSRILEEEYQRALRAGAKEEYLSAAKGGLTGVVGVLKGGRPGPVVGFRFDIDSNEMGESGDSDHLPAQLGFVSQSSAYAHMCGHDAHTAVGLLLAKCLADRREDLCGTVKIIFQPNEENLSGAAAMAGKGVVDDLDYLLAGHIGVSLRELGQICFNVHNIMAVSRFEVTFKGRSAHAAGNPHKGKNALHGACAAVSNLLGIARHSGGATRINVGTLEAGSFWNIIPERAAFRFETRGNSNKTNDYMVKRAFEIIEGAAKMHDLQYEIKPAAASFGGENSPDMIAMAERVAKGVPSVSKIVPHCDFSGSEDVTVFMDRVQKRGGQALFTIFGTPVHGGHHNPKFDIDEKVIQTAAEFFLAMHEEITGNVRQG